MNPSKITFLGLSPSCIDIASDLANTIYHINEFDVIKNLEVEGAEEKLLNEFFLYNFYLHNTYPFYDQLNNKYFFGLTGPRAKKIIFNFFLDNYGIDEGNYDTLIHPTSYYPQSTLVNRGVLIEPLVSISTFSEIDFGVTVKRSSSIGHNCTLKKFVSIHPGAKISGNVQIGAATTIGTGAIIIHDKTIGSNCLIGAGSVVTKNIPDNVVAYGNPCKIIRPNI